MVKIDGQIVAHLFDGQIFYDKIDFWGPLA
jgi:hypothetical protein